jgi:NTE family protein
VGAGLLELLTEESAAGFAQRVTEVRLPPGTIVFEIGDPGDALYVVRSGLIDVRTGGREESLGTLGPGEVFGEQSLLTGRPRSATAVAQTEVTLGRLDHADFVSLVASDPEFAAIVARQLSERMVAPLRAGLGWSHGRLVVVGTASPGDAATLGRELAAACGQLLGSEPILLAAGPASRWQREALPKGSLVVRSDQLPGAVVRGVRERSLVVVLCSGEIRPELLEQADHVLVDYIPSEDLARRITGGCRALELPLDADRVAALAREVCGRRVGLALGSGGTRGWGHVGVLQVLAEEGLPVDLVSGASAGAVAGALFLGGMPPTDMLDVPTVTRDVLLASLRSYRPTLGSFLSGRPFVQYLRDKLGRDARIEDLPRPFVVATTDLDTREPVHLDAGPLPEAVVASAAVNGLFPAFRIDGRRLVDGGASDPVPVAALRERGADIVIAVNVMAIGKGAAGFYTPRVRIPMPGLIDTLFIGLDTVMTQAAVHSCQLADVVVQPEAANAQWHEVLPAAKYAAAGRKAMHAALPRVRELLGQRAA